MLKKLLKKILKIEKVTEVNYDSDNKETYKLLIDIKLQNGRIWSSQIKNKKVETLHDAEFKVFSQWGDDGIIQYLINYLEIKNKIFVEFGVEDYLESNTRFLLINDNWSGLVIDGSEMNIAKIKKDEIYWKYDLIAKSAFITKDNINQLIEEEGISDEIGLLHIDIDGNDYWIWKALTIVKPILMIVEYNSVFGYARAITIPYEEDFVWTAAHYSNLYFGTSILGLCDLAEEKGYSFIGSNSAGNNAYFVKNEFLKGLNPLTAKEGYVEMKFRQSRDKDGNLNYLRGNEILKSINGMPIYNTRSNKIEKL
ncbi:hypothetical protein [Gillisia sp. Hel_I_29]|uniref:hypothetical protein n=1 Tax=Gillisia sp. Hel_I_29 TaxID=1249975 RepID=UPI00055364E9|nr:hypothetical protein [Gillisia sp. Hel_I_29]